MCAFFSEFSCFNSFTFSQVYLLFQFQRFPESFITDSFVCRFQKNKAKVDIKRNRVLLTVHVPHFELLVDVEKTKDARDSLLF